MASWRNTMPSGMILKSEPFASNLSDPQHRYTLERFYASSGMAYRPIGNPLSIADFLEYARWFQQQTRIEVADATLIDLRQADNRFELALADGGVAAVNLPLVGEKSLGNCVGNARSFCRLFCIKIDLEGV